MTTNAAATAKGGTDSARLQAPLLTDGQWAVVEPFLGQGRPTGRPPKWPMRLVLEAVLFVLKTGCQWHMLPAAYPPRATVHWWFMRWAMLGTTA